MLRENLSLQLDSYLGYQLSNKAGEQIQLEHSGQQVYLAACPVKLELESCLVGNLLDNSLMPDTTKLEHSVSFDLEKQEVQDQGGATSFTLENCEQEQLKNKPALGTTALPEQVTERVACKKGPKKPSAQEASEQHSLVKQKQKGQQKADKLRSLRMTSSIAKVQLDLLTPQDPENSLEEQASRDLSLRIFLTLSLMKQWQLKATRFRTAWPQQASTQLRSLGLRTSEVDKQIFLGDQLGVMIHENSMIIGGEKLEQECFMHKLSASLPLEDTQELAEGTPLSFLGRTLEYKQADNSISLQLPPAFFLQLIRRYSLEEAATRRTPVDELSASAPSSNTMSLSAERAKLYRQTVGDLRRSVLLRPDLSFAVQQLGQSMSTPTESAEAQLVSVLRYLQGTLGHSISLQPPRRWQKAQSLELLAFASSSSWSGTGKSSSGLSLFFMGVPLAASTTIQATTSKATELACVKRACSIAFHNKSSLQDLQLDEPMTLRVLLGGPLAMQLGLSRNHRHMHLWSKFGQLQLSKVRTNQNLAASLTNKSASGLDRLLLKLDEGQITHLICARLKYDLYDFFRGCFWAFSTRKTGPKHPLKKSYRSYFRRAQI